MLRSDELQRNDLEEIALRHHKKMSLYAFGKKREKCLQKRKLRNIDSTFLAWKGFTFSKNFIHPLARNLGN